VNTLTDLFKMEQVKAIGSVVDWEHPKTGPFKTMNVIFNMSETPGSLRVPPPGLAAHTDDGVRALGKSEDEIARLKEVGACG
jgi:crotonobetainyl-CoA:carnitine CoA-transferase CaiB-like acyl-CoA transferase